MKKLFPKARATKKAETRHHEAAPRVPGKKELKPPPVTQNEEGFYHL